MSVICKVYIRDVRDLGSGKKLVSTQCVAENEVMAEYNPAEEDKLFSRYSPSGEADFVVDDNTHVPQGLGLSQPKLYLMFVRGKNVVFKNAITFASISCRSVTDFGGTSKQFNFSANWPDRHSKIVWPQTSQFAHKIMIDNPGASDQFSPGQTDWWVGVYDAQKHTMSEVVASFELPVDDEDSEQ